TRTIYTFEDAGVSLTLTFLTAALPYDIDILSRPVTYVIFDWKAIDGKDHKVDVQLDISGLLVVNTPDQQVIGSHIHQGGLSALRIGSTEQAVLAKKGDDIRIDWGYLYVAAPTRSIEAHVLS